MGFIRDSVNNYLYKDVRHDGTEKYEIDTGSSYVQVYDDRVVSTLRPNSETIFYSQITDISFTSLKVFGGEYPEKGFRNKSGTK